MANSAFTNDSDSLGNYNERQKNEVEAIQSMFASDFIDLRTEKSNQPAMFEIKVGPRRGASMKGAHVKVVLCIQFEVDYPKRIPKIKVKNEKGLSSEQVNKLQNELMNKAKSFAGEEMVLNLIYHIEEYLEAYNFEKPSSFYDEMMKNQKKQEAAKATSEKKKKDNILREEEEKNKKIKDEAKRRHQVIRRKQKARQFSDDDDDDDSSSTNAEYVSPFESPVGSPCNHNGEGRNLDIKTANRFPIEPDDSEQSNNLSLLSLQKLQTTRIARDFDILTNLGQGAYGYVIKVKNKVDDRLYAIKIIDSKHDSKLFKNIKTEVKLLSCLNHENIVRYYNSWIEEDCSIENQLKSQQNSEEQEEEEEESSSYSLSEFIVFQDEDDDDEDDEDDDEDDAKDDDDNDLEVDGTAPERPAIKKKYLCIQMEYCEKSTLRTCIEKNLYKDVNRVWRLFRELLDALAHIHDQGIIHRDLKPGNIFLDSYDHIKIGDFGLARIHKPKLQQTVNLTDFKQEISQNETCLMSSLTTDIGTSYYMSPEMSSSSGHYDQQVDMYSLGIIFFEMCYFRMETGMERHKVLMNLRHEKIFFPDNFSTELENQKEIIEDLLVHKSECRPTSKQLLQCGLLPPLEIEEAKVNNLLSSAISNSQSKTYKHIVKSFFNQKYDEVCDIMYDDEVFKPCNVRYSLLQQNTIESLIKVFSEHGAIRISTPFLMPKNKIHSDSNVTFMDQNGQLVCLPDNHKVPLIRYVKRRNIHNLKRYTIDRIFIGKTYGLHPRENMECSFDIITPTLHLIPDSEIIYLIEEIINEFSELKARNFSIVINHATILKALLLYCGVVKNKHEEILDLMEKQGEKTKHIQEALEKLEIDEQKIGYFIKMLKLEGQLDDVQKGLHLMAKCKGEVQTKLKQGLKELQDILYYCDILEIKLPIKIKLGFLRHVNQYSGVFFEVHSFSKKRTPDVLAAGGRYDKLMADYTVPLYTKRDTPTSSPCAVGVSISLDLIVTILNREKEDCVKRCEFMVCANSDKNTSKILLKKAHSLWKKNKSAILVYENVQSLDKIEKQCKIEGISKVSIIKDQHNSKEMLIEDTKWKKKTNKIDNSEPFSEMETKSRTQGPSFRMHFLTERNKRFVENQISKVLNSGLNWIPSNTSEINVLVVDFPMSTIKDIVARIDIANEKVFAESINSILELFKSKRRNFHELSEKIREIRFVKGSSHIILYTIKDHYFKII